MLPDTSEHKDLSHSLFTRRSCWISVVGIFLISLATLIILRLMGRVFWCKCGSWSIWSGDIWTMHNSQHLLDPYSFTHILHGVFFCGFLYFLPATVKPAVRFMIAIVLEAGWEVLENTEFIINRYREATISLDYFGDSILNSISDIWACAAGYVAAVYLRFWKSLLFIALTELLLVLTIRDCLTLNIIMLIWPLEFIKEWQMG